MKITYFVRLFTDIKPVGASKNKNRICSSQQNHILFIMYISSLHKRHKCQHSKSYLYVWQKIPGPKFVLLSLPMPNVKILL